MKDIDILFVNPNAKKENYGTLASEFAGLEPPVWCGLKAAYARDKGFEVDVLDSEVENISPSETAERIISKNPLLVDVVVMGINPSASSTPKMESVKEIVKKLKNIDRNIKVLLTGIHPSALPKSTLQSTEADFIIKGEGFKSEIELIQTLKKGEKNYSILGLWYRDGKEIKSNPAAPIMQNIDDLPFMAWDLLPMDKYRAHNWHCLHDLKNRSPYAAIYTSFGCPFKCTYCNIHCMYDGKPGIRYRDPEKVVEELKILSYKYNVKNIKVLDELFVLNQERVEKICNLIIDTGLDFNIWVYSRIDTMNKKLLHVMKRAGINWVAYGIESANKKIRENVHKGRFSIKNIEDTIKMTQVVGIYVIGNYMFGLPEDTMETMQDTLDLAKKLNCEYANFYTVMAYPGSQLYNEMVEKNVRLPNNWLGYGQLSRETIPLPNRYLSSEEILAFRDKAFIEYFSNPVYLESIKKKFGEEAVNHIRRMLNYKIERKILM